MCIVWCTVGREDGRPQKWGVGVHMDCIKDITTWVAGQQKTVCKSSHFVFLLKFYTASVSLVDEVYGAERQTELEGNVLVVSKEAEFLFHSVFTKIYKTLTPANPAATKDRKG